MQFAKLKKAIPLVTLAGCTLIVGAWVKQDSKPAEAAFESTVNPSGRLHRSCHAAEFAERLTGDDFSDIPIIRPRTWWLVK
jgi:hypothetical protein